MNGEQSPYWDEEAHRVQRAVNAKFRREHGWNMRGLKPKATKSLNESAITNTMKLLGCSREIAVVICRSL